jgi:SAM-dependent methyltransferase
MRSLIRINVGCGASPMQGWVNLDIRSLPGVDVTRDVVTEGLPYDENAVDEVYAGHFLEHIPEHQTPGVLGEFLRVLRPGGVLTVVTPNWRAAAAMYVRGEMNLSALYYGIALGLGEYILGWDQGNGSEQNPDTRILEHEAISLPHRNAYDPEKLFEVVSRAGFVGVCPVDIETNPYVVSRAPWQCGVRAEKPC